MPSAAVIDSQTVKGGQLPAVSCDYDAGKKIKGHKRHPLTDTNGLLLGLVVTPACRIVTAQSCCCACFATAS